MKIYTLQLAKWRMAKRLKVPLVDTTVKTGRKELAPSWEMVLGIKNKELSTDQYTEQYIKLMKDSQVQHPEFWLSLLEQETLCLACYCTAGFFCHRYLLADLLRTFAESHNVPCEIVGELKES